MANAQITTYLGDETAFYAETKQLNQFIRRFNNEENKDGVRYQPNDKRYRNEEDRKKYLEILFDASNVQLTRDKKSSFIADVTQKGEPAFLDFHQDGWFAEVEAIFNYQGKEEKVVLFMKIEQEKLGYKWVLTNVHFEPYARMFKPNLHQGTKQFLHPMSHELDFMNLNKAFEDKTNIEDYADQHFAPNYLSLFFYEFKKGLFVFKTVSDVKFHFFQVKNWYFEVTEFNRQGLNRGWLISNLTKVPENQKEMFRKFILREQ
jgi:hypothetical protein